jgi:hypothetical protein
MARFAATVIVLVLAAGSAHARTKLDRETVHNLPQAFCAAFSRHDGHQLAQLMAGDIDFVVVGATRLLSGLAVGMSRPHRMTTPCLAYRRSSKESPRLCPFRTRLVLRPQTSQNWRQA